MSVQFGIWNFDSKPVDTRVLEAADSFLSPYAPDGVSRYCKQGVALLHHALHTTVESRHEKQPYVSGSGCVFVWDGRLDNREDLSRELGLASHSTDVEIVAASFDRWGTDCFAKLLGDWAVTVWSDRDQLLILARDLIGIRPLYYHVEGKQIRWSSILDPLVALTGRRFDLNYEYVAGWFAMYPAADSTPYTGISAVPPCSFVCLRPQGQSITKYWDFNPSKRIVHCSDADYEHHFRGLFRQAVHRRLRSDRTICAELSGGMDSPSITCMADLIANTSPEVPNIETLSYFDDSEPLANERPYFEKVEQKRGRTGLHINTTGMAMFDYDLTAPLQTTPGAAAARPRASEDPQTGLFERKNIRVVLSGIGGDEVMGGVPTPHPELQDLIAQGQFRRLAHQLKVWALNKRKPWFFLLGETIGGFLPAALLPEPKYRRPVPWLTDAFVVKNRDTLSGFERRVLLFGSLPSFQMNLSAIETLRRQLATKCLPKEPAHEPRYPFLDRDLLEFIYAIPREQLVRPGYRRSLMRRALAGIVPEEVLERRRKAYATRGARVAVAREWDSLERLIHNMASAQMQIVNEEPFRKAVEAVKTSEEVPLVRFLRTVLVEVWLRNVIRHEAISDIKLSASLNQVVPEMAGSAVDVA
jgi:asparagine synthase (glutamine-hydrolysing)